MRGLRDGRLRSTEQEVTRAATEAKQMPTQRIATQHLLHLQGQRWSSCRCDPSPATHARQAAASNA